MTQQVGESRERGVLAVDRPVVAVMATGCNRKYWLGWEINPVSGGNTETYRRGSVLSTLALTVFLLRGQYIPNCTARAIADNSTKSPGDRAPKTTPWIGIADRQGVG
ncbi:hypothetical protein Zmor_020359 [Zophobas morio]|uniref:Uncharacterized protein n=1 Tax=Zophobas morio TaxID=2755281 RepID=A0AA38M9Y0_9CUCU|nr:hypothetical protein Zmor_020359 [Zophobas morio]